jgi:hypothetical protein
MTLEDVVRIAVLCDGTVYGGYPRDMILGVRPKNINVWFQFDSDLGMFTDMCPDVVQIQGNTLVLGCGTPVHCLVGPGYPDIDFECNSLAITSNGVSSLVVDTHDVLALMHIVNDIRSKVAREIVVDPKRRVKMWSEGWNIISENLAASKIQFQFRKAMAVPYYHMCKKRLMREGQELAQLGF